MNAYLTLNALGTRPPSVCIVFWRHHEGRLGIDDVFPLSGISGLSFDSPFLSPLFFLSLLPSLLVLFVLSLFC